MFNLLFIFVYLMIIKKMENFKFKKSISSIYIF